jgi:hypothetical protein
VMGRSRTRLPVAICTALAIAGATDTAVSSPRPRAGSPPRLGVLSFVVTIRVVRMLVVQRGLRHLVRPVGEAVLGELGKDAAPRGYRGTRFTCVGSGSLAGIEDPACGPAHGNSGSLPCSLQ